jgi:putative ABC transport system permease protein
MDSFHYHGDLEQLPLSAILFWPNDEKSATLSKARVNQLKKYRMLQPTSVMDDLMAFVLRVRNLVDGIGALLAGITASLTVLVFLLSSQLRKREMRTLERLGCSRFFVLGLYLSEFAVVFGLAILLAAAGVFSARWLLSDLLPSLV